MADGGTQLMAKDIIFIEGLEIETIIGVYQHERDIKQKVVLEIEMTLPESDAASSDDLRHTVDYDAVSKLVTSYVIDTQYQLIESLAEQVCPYANRRKALRSKDSQGPQVRWLLRSML